MSLPGQSHLQQPHVLTICDIKSISRTNFRFKANFPKKMLLDYKAEKPMKQAFGRGIIQVLSGCPKCLLHIFYSVHLCVGFIPGQKDQSPLFGMLDAHQKRRRNIFLSGPSLGDKILGQPPRCPLHGAYATVTFLMSENLCPKELAFLCFSWAPQEKGLA